LVNNASQAFSSFFAFGEIEFREEFLGTLKGYVIAILVIILDDRLLVLGKILHGHNQ